MNCQEFSEHVTEIARGAVMDAAARAAALGHAETCAACAARLERERALTAALRATAESFDNASAPARVETALLAAFRTAHAGAGEPAAVQPLAPAATRENVHTVASRFGRRARVAVAAAAVAASLIVTFAVVKRPQPQPAAAPEQIANVQSPATPQQSSAAQTTNARQPSSQVEPAENSQAGDETGRRSVEGNGGGRPVRTQRAAGGSRGTKGVKEPGVAFNIDGGQAVFAEGETVAASASEVAGLRGDEAALTDFVPLNAGASTAPLDGGQVVRVEAPRSALASLGLPVDARRANEKVKADLLLAHDGTAHAIRFVR